MAEDLAPFDAQATLAALRARGAAQVDPVRLHFLEALARRAGEHDGEARQAITGRLAQLAAAFEAGLDEAATPDALPMPSPSPLAALVGELARHHPAPVAPAPAPARARMPAASTRLRTPPAPEPVPAPSPAVMAAASAAAQELAYFRRTWSRLAADQRIAQSRAALPGNAGPLNSQHLVHRALTLMRELSPAYFERFVSHVDALQWVARANAADDVLGAARAEREQRAGRTKPG